LSSTVNVKAPEDPPEPVVAISASTIADMLRVNTKIQQGFDYFTCIFIRRVGSQRFTDASLNLFHQPLVTIWWVVIGR